MFRIGALVAGGVLVISAGLANPLGITAAVFCDVSSTCVAVAVDDSASLAAATNSGTAVAVAVEESFAVASAHFGGNAVSTAVENSTAVSQADTSGQSVSTAVG